MHTGDASWTRSAGTIARAPGSGSSTSSDTAVLAGLRTQHDGTVSEEAFLAENNLRREVHDSNECSQLP